MLVRRFVCPSNPAYYTVNWRIFIEDTLTLIQPVEAGYAHLLDLPPLDLKIFRRAYRDELCEK